jgi:hypothetical protein
MLNQKQGAFHTPEKRTQPQNFSPEKKQLQWQDPNLWNHIQITPFSLGAGAMF